VLDAVELEEILRLRVIASRHVDVVASLA